MQESSDGNLKELFQAKQGLDLFWKWRFLANLCEFCTVLKTGRKLIPKQRADNKNIHLKCLKSRWSKDFLLCAQVFFFFFYRYCATIVLRISFMSYVFISRKEAFPEQLLPARLKAHRPSVVKIFSILIYTFICSVLQINQLVLSVRFDFFMKWNDWHFFQYDNNWN